MSVPFNWSAAILPQVEKIANGLRPLSRVAFLFRSPGVLRFSENSDRSVGSAILKPRVAGQSFVGRRGR